MNEIITVNQIKIAKRNINDKEINTVNARELYEFMEVETRFNDWITRRIEEYEFINNIDYLKMSKSDYTGIGKAPIEYYISINMAKELAMVERNQKGKEARKYFIDMEEKALQNQYAMIPDFTNPVESAKAWIKEYEAKTLLADTLEKSKDKIEYYDAVMDSNDCTEVSTAAKTLNFEIGRNKVFKLLRDSGYLKTNNEPYQQYCGNKKYFRMIQKHYYNKEGQSKTYYQTQILPKGIELIKNLYLKSNPEYHINNINEILEIARNMTITSGNSQLTKQTEMFA